jgi:hypothetical protein
MDEITMNKETLSLPVPYTLEMTGSGSFIAIWHPVVPSPEFPRHLEGRSGSSGFKAIERLYGELLSNGVVQL